MAERRVWRCSAVADRCLVAELLPRRRRSVTRRAEGRLPTKLTRGLAMKHVENRAITCSKGRRVQVHALDYVRTAPLGAARRSRPAARRYLADWANGVAAVHRERRKRRRRRDLARARGRLLGRSSGLQAQGRRLGLGADLRSRPRDGIALAGDGPGGERDRRLAPDGRKHQRGASGGEARRGRLERAGGSLGIRGSRFQRRRLCRGWSPGRCLGRAPQTPHARHVVFPAR